LGRCVLRRNRRGNAVHSADSPAAIPDPDDVLLSRDQQMILGAAFISSLGTFGMQVLLPALPAIATHFGTSPGRTQLLISVSMLSLGLGNLVVAPASDRFGRRPVILAGLSLFLASSVVCLLAPSLELLIVARALQAFGAGAAMAVVRATLADAFGVERAASAIAYTGMAILVVPMIAPTIGGLAIEGFGWRAPFGLAVVLGAAVLAFAWRRVGETHRVSLEERARRPRTIASYRLLLSSPAFVGISLYGGFMLGAVYGFVTGGPYLGIRVYGLSPVEYGLWFAVPSAASLVGFLVAGRFSRAVGGARMMLVGVVGSTLGVIVILLPVALHAWTPVTLFLPASVLCFATALSAPNSAAAAIMVRPEIAGAASGLLGFMQLVVAAMLAQLLASLENGTPWPLAWVLVGANGAALLAYVWIRRSGAIHDGRAHEHSHADTKESR
jgi:DHA1 family bicyclomycin/chloramphenicol resistance-like MFS transporter